MQLQSSLHPQFSTFQEFFYWFCTNTKLWKLVRFRENQISVDFQHFHQFYIPLDKKDTAGGSEKVQYLLHLLMKMFGGLVADCVASIIGLHPASQLRISAASCIWAQTRLEPGAWSSTEIVQLPDISPSTILNPMQRRWLHSQCNAHNLISY